MPELVDAYEPELLECGSGLRRRSRTLSSSLERESPASMGAAFVGELDGVVIRSDSDVDSRRSARSRSLLSRTHRMCMPEPRWPPTPAFKSSSRARTRQTSRGQRESLGRKGRPLKCLMAACKCGSDWKLTKAQFERAMRNMEETPPNRESDEAVDVDPVAVEPIGPAGALCVDIGPTEEPGEGGELKNRQSSSCVASEGTFPVHITHSERWAGGLG